MAQRWLLCSEITYKKAILFKSPSNQKNHLNSQHYFAAGAFTRIFFKEYLNPQVRIKKGQMLIVSIPTLIYSWVRVGFNSCSVGLYYCSTRVQLSLGAQRDPTSLRGAKWPLGRVNSISNSSSAHEAIALILRT